MRSFIMWTQIPCFVQCTLKNKLWIEGQLSWGSQDLFEEQMQTRLSNISQGFEIPCQMWMHHCCIKWERRKFLFCIQTGRLLKLHKTKTPLQRNFGYPASFSVHIWCEFRRLTCSFSFIFLHIRRLLMARILTGDGKVSKHNQAIQHFQGYEVLHCELRSLVSSSAHW